MSREILIVGTSARAAAQSTVRAGWRPFAIDQFADEDLLACCPTRRVDDYPQGIAALASQFPNCPFLYTGAMENHPEVIATLARERPLLGNPPDVVARQCADPWTLRPKLAERRLLTPEIRRADEPVRSGEWLSKPLRSGGGIGIRRIEEASGGSSRTHSAAKTHYRQRFVAGEPISALYVAARGQAALLGVTRQLVGCAWAGADPFLYVGNVGPLVVPSAVVRQLHTIGDILARDFQLVGLFGIDAILHGDDVLTLEVNPRYTAAVEILERSLGLLAIHHHLEACEQLRLPATIVSNGNCIRMEKRSFTPALPLWFPGNCPDGSRPSQRMLVGPSSPTCLPSAQPSFVGDPFVRSSRRRRRNLMSLPRFEIWHARPLP